MAEIVELAEPLYRARKWGPFKYAAYVATHAFEYGRPLSLFVGTARTRRGAEKLALRELAARRAPAVSEEER